MPAHRSKTPVSRSKKGKGGRRDPSARQEARNKETVHHLEDSGAPTEGEFNCMAEFDECEVIEHEHSDKNDEASTTAEPGRGSDTSSDTSTETGSQFSESPTAESDTARCSRKVRFRRGDSAVLASEYDETANIWIGIIMDLRANRDSDDVWVKVRWCWSGSDLAVLIKSFDASDFAPFERATSDYATIENARTLNAVKYLHEWDEGSLDPPELHADTAFVRSILSWSRRVVDPKPGFTTCMGGRCKQTGYNPFPAEPQASTANMVMHFCPRLTCRKWYHEDCLVYWNEVDSPEPEYLADRGVRLLAVDPDHEHNHPLLAYHTEKLDTKSEDDDELPTSLSLDIVLAEMSSTPSAISHLPPALVEMAQCPIVRRPGPAMDGWSPAGNVKEVVIARRLVYAGLEQDFADPSWSMLTPQELCDEIGASFRYASPYSPYWERREKELQDETWMYTPPVVCPVCKGAV